MVLLYNGLLSILKKNEELWTALDIFSRYEVKKKKPKVQNFMKRNLTFVYKRRNHMYCIGFYMLRILEKQIGN